MNRALTPRRNPRTAGVPIEDLVPSILTFLATDPSRFDRFVAVTGLSVKDIRTVARESAFAENLLHYIGSDESLLQAYAAQSAFSLETIEATRLAALVPSFDD